MITYTDIIKLHPGHGGWNYILVPETLVPKNIERGGWGSIKIECIIGETSWRTSMFYLKRANAYFLGIKKAVRLKEDLYVGDTIIIYITWIR